MMQRTLEQERAAHALKKIKNAQKDLGADEAEKLASYIEGLPASIINNGLGQTMAALLSQSKGKVEDPHYMLYKFTEEWLCGKSDQAPYPSGQNLMDSIVRGDRQSYMHAQAEAMQWLDWLKKFAVAFLKKPEGGRKS
jgi:CRISPR-associated protein Cmr5